MGALVDNRQLMIPVGAVIVVVSVVFGMVEWLESEVHEEIRDHRRSLHPGVAKESDVTKLETHLVKIEELIRDTRERVIRLESRDG